MKNRIIVRSFCLCAALLGSNLSPVWAANVTKLDTTSMAASTANWSAAPAATDIGEFNGAASAVSLAGLSLGGADLTLGGLLFDGTMQGPVSVATGNNLILGASGIDMSAANQNVSFTNAVSLGAPQNWNVVAPQTLTVGGSIAINNLLTLNGTGTVALNAANTGTGGLTLNSGTMTFGNAAAAGGASGTITLVGGTWSIPGAGLTIATPINVTGNSAFINANASGSTTFTGNVTGNGTWNLNFTLTNQTTTFGGASGLSGFSGTIKVADNTISNTFLRFSVSSGSSAATFNLGNGSVIVHTRNGQAVNFGALSGGPNTTIMGARSTGTIVNTPYSIGGNNLSTTFAGVITNGTVAGGTASITKVGTGTLTLTGTNNAGATGPNEVSAGTLQIGDGNADGSLPSGGALIDAAGTLVFDRPDNYTTIINITNNGALTIIGGGTNTYNTGAYSGSGSINVINGGFVMAGTAATLGQIYTAPGMTFDASPDGSLTSVLGLSGSGTVKIVGGSLTAVTVTGGVSPGGSGTAGTLTINGGLTENGNVNNQFVLSTVGGTNDLLTVNGNLTVSGLNTISLSEFGGGAVPPGVYPLISYTGTLTGGAGNFAVSAVGFNGTVTNITSVTPNQIAVIVTPPVRPALNLTWVGDSTANTWDLATVHDWINGGTNYAFQAGDSAFFTDSGSANLPVTVKANVFPASLVVSNTTAKHYTFTGSGSIAGSTGLTKTNGGILTLLNTNSYTGPTVIGGGVLELETGALLSSGAAGAIGAASSDPSNLVFYGSILRYSGSDTNVMDHGMTTVSGVTVDVTNVVGVFTASGVVTGPGGLTKVGQGTLVVQNANTYAGGTVISNGMLAMGNNNANWNGGTASGVGSTNSPVTFMGTNGTLQLYGYPLYVNDASASFTYNNFQNPLVVPAGQAGTLQLPARGNPGTGAGAGLNSSLTGSGTLNLVANYVRYPLSGNWSGFTGQINVTGAGFPNANANTVGAVTANVDELRLNYTNYANAAIYLYGSTAPGNTQSPPSTLVMCQTVGSGATINIGELGGDFYSIIGTGTGSSGNTTWSVGWKNTTNTFSGVIADDAQTGVGVTSITKAGTGEWILAGINTYSGSTIVSNGVLALVKNPLSYNDGSIASSANIFINAGAVLDVSALSNPTLTLTTNILGGGGTLNGSVISSATINPGSASAMGTLTINGNLTESGGANNNFQLSTVGNSDVIKVQGNLDVSSGIQNISLSGFNGGTITPGTYPLFTYTGTLSGGTNNLAVNVGATAYTARLTSITTTTPPQIAVIIGAPARQPANLVWAGDNGANNWDTTGLDWLVGATHYAFQPGDSVFFTDAGHANPTVTLQGALYPASVVVSNSTLASYTLTGSGNITGTIGLTKTNSGTLTILTTNTYTGPTVIGGGTISISSLPNGGLASPIGAASNNSTNLLFAGGTLAYTGPSAGTDRGATLNGSGGVFDVIGGTILTNNGVITGSGALILTDAGTLILANAANTYTGGTTITNGTLVLSNATAAGTGNLNLGGGTLSINGLTIADVVNAAGNATIANGSSAATFTGNFIGAGTLNLAEPTNSTITFGTGGQLSAFTGTIRVSDLVTNVFLRFSGCTGGTGGSFDLGNGSIILHTRTGNAVSLGSLKGGASTTVEGARSATATISPYSIGGNNASTTYYGTIMDGIVAGGTVSLTKVGTGTLTLAGTNTYTGPTTVSNGVLLVNSSIVNSTTNDGPVTVSGGTLGGSGTLGGEVIVQAGGTLAPGAGTNVAGTVLTLNSNLTLQAGGTVLMQVSHSANDQVTSAGTIIYGGTLMIATNAGDATPYHVGDKFTLFNLNGGTYNAGSSFAAIQPPPGPGLGWSGTNLTIDGSIQVVTSSTPPAPVAGFSGMPTNIFVTQTVTFTDASTGSITNWVWSFGDGHGVTNTTSASVPHAYAAAGSYTVSLTVNGAGGSGNSTLPNYVVVKPKTALGKVTLSGGKLVFSGTNGPAGAQYRIMTATNVALPLAGWTPVWTNVFAADGSYSYTNTPGASASSFFLLISP